MIFFKKGVHIPLKGDVYIQKSCPDSQLVITGFIDNYISYNKYNNKLNTFISGGCVYDKYLYDYYEYSQELTDLYNIKNIIE